MASRSLGTLTVDLIAKVGGFTRGMTQAEREAAKSSKAIEARMRKLGKGIDAAFKIAAAGAVAAFGLITVGVTGAINRLDDIAKAAQKVGITTQAFSKLAYAAELSGVEFGQLESALAKLAKTQDMAAQGGKEQLEYFRALDVAFKNADGTLRNTDEVLADLADRFSELPDGANKTAAGMALLGRSGAQLIPLLNGGSDGLAEMGRELENLGGVVTPEAAKAAEQFNDDLTRLRVAVDGVWQGIAMQLLPDLVRLTGEMSEANQEGRGFEDTGRKIAAVIATVAETAYRAYKNIELFVLGLGEMAARAVNLAATNPLSGLGIVDRLTGGSIARESGILADSLGAGAAQARVDADNGIGLGRGVFKMPDPAAESDRETEALRKRAAALDELRGEQERATAARKAASEAAKLQRERDRELEEQARAHAAAQDALTGVLRKQAEEMGGPVTQAAFAYKDVMVELQGAEDKLIALGKMDAGTAAAIAQARTQAAESYEKSVAAIRAQLDPLDALINDMQLELDLLGMTNAERVTELELQRLIYEYRQRGIELSDKEIAAARARIQAKAEEVEATHEQIAALDGFRSSFEDNVAGVLDGSKSIGDALRSLADDILAQLARIAAQKLTESLFGEQGTSGGGAFGGFIGNLFSAFSNNTGFGGARASGGPVYPGKAYLVGEHGPELIRPMGAGMVSSASETRAAMGHAGRGGDTTIVIQGATSPRSLDRVAIQQARLQRRSTSEFA